MKEIVLVLDNIRSIHNVGSIFRTADAVGVLKIYLCGVTPAPIDRFGREVEALSKVSLGAEKTIVWESVQDTLELCERLQNEEYEIVALEQYDTSVDIYSYESPDKIALILGQEVDGVTEEVLDICDSIIELPMVGEKESLNVSVATGVALYHLQYGTI